MNKASGYRRPLNRLGLVVVSASPVVLGPLLLLQLSLLPFLHFVLPHLYSLSLPMKKILRMKVEAYLN